MINLDAHIEALLFLKGEPMSFKELAKILDIQENEARSAADFLREKLLGRGIQLIQKDNSLMLATSPESANFTRNLIQEEFSPQLSRAGLEVLSIVVYKGPISRSSIDYIRGVNSAFCLRNLLVRGLLERKLNPQDNRSYLYHSSFQLLQHLGIKNVNELPEFRNLNEQIEDFINKGNDE
jgi:segregation and condensation protein B